ncbi:hypothetical protein IFM89_009774 [Coptis chinensis]|uniref:SGTA homodimerisation domain-containing protein n=1 Tax=Coptis chinensis TaxID=261450 RepID=A0A835LU87_9MAGN|nr:hypothetical protein IFM89_009774 [Coptis chinensis]
MNNVKIDSPVSRRIVLAFFDFLNSVEPTPGVDLEGLDVVRECLGEVFKLDPSSTNDRTEPGVLVKYFTTVDASETDTLVDGPSTSSRRDSDDSLSHIEKQQDQGFAVESHASGASKDELFGQFFAALEKIHFFSTTVDGDDEHWQLDRATQLFHEAVQELEKSGCQTINTLNLAETFKSQGNKAMQSKLYSDAIELYTYAIALCENNSVYYCNRAAAFTQIHKYVEAIRDCKKSIQIDPNYSKAYSRLGLAYYAQGSYRDAIDKGFTKALQLDPDNESVKENIRVAEQKLRDPPRAEQHQNGRSTPHSNQEATNGQSSGGPRNRSGPSPIFNSADLPSDITSMLMNMVGQHPEMRTNFDSETSRSDEPEVTMGGNISLNFGEDGSEDLMGTLRSMMGMFSGAQSQQNPNGNVHRGPTPKLSPYRYSGYTVHRFSFPSATHE